jgi:tRNA pseudouridine55 synthase
VRRAPDFVLPVDKPEGPTSHDVVQVVRRSTGQRRAGHTGTLDPFASGLLLVCVGRATRLVEYLTGLDKTYEAIARLGQTTDTLDREGQLLEERAGWADLDEASVVRALERFSGAQSQIPPAFSAKKVGGEAAHRKARRGERVGLAPIQVTIHEIELTSFDLPHVGLRVRCSSGTYVRALARDVGEALGVGGHLVALRRTRVGGFDVAQAIGMEALAEPTAVEAAAVAPLDALAHLPRVVADDRRAAKLIHGQPVPLDGSAEGLVAVAHAGALLAIGECAGGLVHPRKVFA